MRLTWAVWGHQAVWNTRYMYSQSFRSISYNADNFLLNLDHGLQWTKVSKFNSAFHGILFVVTPYQLIELQNVSLFEPSVTASYISGQTATCFVHMSSDLSKLIYDDDDDISSFHSIAFTRWKEIYTCTCRIYVNQFQCIKFFILKINYFIYTIILIIKRNASNPISLHV